MSDKDIVFNGSNFIDNEKNILRLSIVSKSDSTALAYWNANSTLTWSQLMDAFRKDVHSFTGADDFFDVAKNLNPLWTTVEKTAFSDALFEDYKAQMGATDLTLGDWAVLGTNGVTDSDLRQQFKYAFSHFLISYPYIPVTPGGPAISVGDGGANDSGEDNFFVNWGKYMARTADFDDGTSLASDLGADSVDLAAYEQIYVSFFPNATAAMYVARIKDFYNEILKSTGGGSPGAGWFIPSQAFHTWFTEMREEYLTLNRITSVEITTTVSSGTARRLLVLDRILRLLIQMIDVLQRISASQAQRLSFLTKWQTAYTALMTDVPQFAPNDGTPLGGTSHSASGRNAVNPHFQAILENVRARRGSVQDEAKQLQTSINSSQDAANQQTQMATALLQQISGILSQIYR